MRETLMGCCIGRAFCHNSVHGIQRGRSFCPKSNSQLKMYKGWIWCGMNISLTVWKPAQGRREALAPEGRVLPSATVLRNWQEFLRLHNNKKELFLFVSEQVVRTAIEGTQIIVTRGEEVLCSPPATRRNKLSPCSHEQVDTRMMVHIPVSHVSINRHWRGSVSCCDFRPKGIMVSYGTRRKHRILLVHLFAKALGPSKSKCFPIFHALTGCDTTSFFAGRTFQMLQGHFSSWQGPPLIFLRRICAQ